MTFNSVPVFALIPARSGSKGVIGKNMRMLGGKRLIDYSILAAKKSKYIDRVYVSSDDESILRHAKNKDSLAIPRPIEFSLDTSPAAEVVNHFIVSLPLELIDQDPYIIYLQPTSPLRNSAHINQAFELMEAEPGRPLVSVTEMDISPFKCFSLDSSGLLQSLFDEGLTNARRQDLPVTFLPNGAIYIFRISEFLLRNGFPSNGSIAFIMTEHESLDIDSENDMQHAELIFGDEHGH